MTCCIKCARDLPSEWRGTEKFRTFGELTTFSCLNFVEKEKEEATTHSCSNFSLICSTAPMVKNYTMHIIHRFYDLIDFTCETLPLMGRNNNERLKNGVIHF